MSTAPITDFTRLATTLEALSTAAEKGDWEQMAALQAEQEQLLAHIRQRPGAGADRSNAAALAGLIQRALAGIRAAQPHIDSLRQCATREMADAVGQRKVSQSYR